MKRFIFLLGFFGSTSFLFAQESLHFNPKYKPSPGPEHFLLHPKRLNPEIRKFNEFSQQKQEETNKIYNIRIAKSIKTDPMPVAKPDSTIYRPMKIKELKK